MQTSCSQGRLEAAYEPLTPLCNSNPRLLVISWLQIRLKEVNVNWILKLNWAMRNSVILKCCPESEHNQIHGGWGLQFNSLALFLRDWCIDAWQSQPQSLKQLLWSLENDSFSCLLSRCFCGKTTYSVHSQTPCILQILIAIDYWERGNPVNPFTLKKWRSRDYRGSCLTLKHWWAMKFYGIYGQVSVWACSVGPKYVEF